MKNSKYKDLIAYATAFVSFILPKIEVEEIILFGSASRGEATKESDIDLFFNIKNKNKEKEIKNIIKEQLNKFYKSYIYKQYKLKGLDNKIEIEVGDLNKWKLKRSIISDGITLYGKYKTTPEKLKGYTLFNINPIKDITKRNKIIRQLFGRKEKTYTSQGIIEKTGGKQLSPASFIIPLENSKEVISFLSSEKLDFSFFELWTDQIY